MKSSTRFLHFNVFYTLAEWGDLPHWPFLQNKSLESRKKVYISRNESGFNKLDSSITIACPINYKVQYTLISISRETIKALPVY